MAPAVGAAPPGVAAPLIVSVPEDPAALLAFSRRSGAGRGVDPGNVSLVVGGMPGAAEPLAARAALAGAVGLGPDDVVYAQQVHGAGAAHVGDRDRGRGARRHADAVPGVDALISTTPGLGVPVMAADCVPLLLVDPGRGVAAVHAGRAGMAAGVVPAAVRALVGSEPGRVVAVIGPGIGGCCYELPVALADQVAAAVPAARARTTWGAPSLDLPAGVTAQLRCAGVARVERAGTCTRCGGDDWFSARATAEGTALPGRHAGIAVRLDPADGARPAKAPWAASLD